MTIQEIIEKLEDLKCEIWEHCELEKNYTQIKVKNTTKRDLPKAGPSFIHSKNQRTSVSLSSCV